MNKMNKIIQTSQWGLGQFLVYIDFNSLRNTTKSGKSYWESKMSRDKTLYPVVIQLFLRYGLNSSLDRGIDTSTAIHTLGFLPNINQKLYLNHHDFIQILKLANEEIRNLCFTMNYSVTGWTFATNYQPSKIFGDFVMEQRGIVETLLASQILLLKSSEYEYCIRHALRKFDYWSSVEFAKNLKLAMKKYPHPINATILTLIK